MLEEGIRIFPTMVRFCWGRKWFNIVLLIEDLGALSLGLSGWLGVLVLYLGKCSPSDFCLSHLEKGHKVTLVLNDLCKSI